MIIVLVKLTQNGFRLSDVQRRHQQRSGVELFDLTVPAVRYDIFLHTCFLWLATVGL